MKTIQIVLLLWVVVSCTTKEKKEQQLKLWYDKPATSWMTEALPIGNGYMGAMFFGGIEKEQIQFTEGTLWSGGPGSDANYNFGLKEGAWKHLAKVRDLLNQGKMDEAHKVASDELSGAVHKIPGGSMFGDYGAQQTMGEIFIDIDHGSKVDNYRRTLDLSNSEARITYSVDGKKYSRTYFGSYPQKSLVYRFENEKPSTYTIEYVSPHQKRNETYKNSIYSFNGIVANNGMEYQTCLKIDTDGKVEYDDGKFKISNVKELTIYHTAATDYTLDFPLYKGFNYSKENKRVLNKLEESSYKEILDEHRTDYQKLFCRVKLDLNSNSNDIIPTDRRLIEYSKGREDLGLEEIYFQYGRYLMISASRPGTMPLNLQGKWNNSTNPPWACDYHMNINQQMLYWPAEVTNLSECHLPLFDYMESLVEPGRISAKEFFNAKGWIVNTMNNPFGYTAPGWGFPWGFFPGGAAWLCQHLWEHYEFTKDVDFLRDRGYPLMKEAALFWVDYLVLDENGFLVSSPSYSPEHGGISRGASMDHQIAWDLLNNCVEACNVLEVDNEFKKKAIVVRDKICPPVIGSWGQLQEWREDVDDPKSVHRHVSHLFALYPGNQITVKSTPGLAKAARVSLNARGDGGTGWSLAWKVNFWARLKDGNRAYSLLRGLLRSTKVPKENMTNGGGSYSNLLCAHPPFQLDGNMGGTAGISEMLVQSHEGLIELLPALPDSWKSGEIKGLKTRGGIEIHMKWKDRKVVFLKVKSSKKSQCQIKVNGDLFIAELSTIGWQTIDI
ncbi:glycoside hydrolase family 95 protein [Prolixibacteraceae bacterium JC049]|nr:glycoside hydrolase family 95 protein [Prolixibacteraceae bacterium JC049]